MALVAPAITITSGEDALKPTIAVVETDPQVGDVYQLQCALNAGFTSSLVTETVTMTQLMRDLRYINFPMGALSPGYWYIRVKKSRTGEADVYSNAAEKQLYAYLTPTLTPMHSIIDTTNIATNGSRTTSNVVLASGKKHLICICVNDTEGVSPRPANDWYTLTMNDGADVPLTALVRYNQQYLSGYAAFITDRAVTAALGSITVDLTGTGYGAAHIKAEVYSIENYNATPTITQGASSFSSSLGISYEVADNQVAVYLAANRNRPVTISMAGYTADLAADAAESSFKVGRSTTKAATGLATAATSSSSNCAGAVIVFSGVPA